MATTSSIDYQQLLKQAQLPGLPTTALHLLELSRNPDNGPNEYAAPIEADPGLAGQILRFVNSSAIGFRSEITSVKLAINLVGRALERGRQSHAQPSETTLSASFSLARLAPPRAFCPYSGSSDVGR